jgi:2-polyprenyl-3-methyl-5-hydroxy-6-metoxy-1,4-benzoquinol methylase
MVSVSEHCPVCGAPRTDHAFQASDLALRAVAGQFSYRKCSVCGSVFAAPQPDDISLAEAYSNSYGNYRTEPSLIERLATPLTNPEVRRFMRHADRRGNLIELGAGNGRFLERLRRCGWAGPLQGIEFDARVAATTTVRTGFYVRSGNLDHETLPEQSYDVIVMRHVIEHLRQPAATLEMVFRTLRPGGLLFIGTPDAGALCARVFGQHWWGYEVPRHLVIFSRTALNFVLNRVGFRVIDCWSGFAPQMWSASLGLLLADKQAPQVLRGLITSMANPVTMAAFSVVSALEVAAGRSTMLSVVARRPN